MEVFNVVDEDGVIRCPLDQRAVSLWGSKPQDASDPPNSDPAPLIVHPQETLHLLVHLETSSLFNGGVWNEEISCVIPLDTHPWGNPHCHLKVSSTLSGRGKVVWTEFHPSILTKGGSILYTLWCSICHNFTQLRCHLRFCLIYPFNSHNSMKKINTTSIAICYEYMNIFIF